MRSQLRFCDLACPNRVCIRRAIHLTGKICEVSHDRWFLNYAVIINASFGRRFGAAQQNIIFGSLLSYKSEIYSLLIQKTNMSEQSQQ